MSNTELPLITFHLSFTVTTVTILCQDGPIDTFLITLIFLKNNHNALALELKCLNILSMGYHTIWDTFISSFG